MTTVQRIYLYSCRLYYDTLAQEDRKAFDREGWITGAWVKAVIAKRVREELERDINFFPYSFPMEGML